MTSKDKTGDKLVASIRKSKTGATTRKAESPSAAEPAAKTAPAKAATSKPAAKSTQKNSGYSAGRRVWPD